MQVSESSLLNFTVDGIRRSMYYDIVVRYETKVPGNWEDAQLIVLRQNPPDPDGPCADWTEDSDRLHVELPSNQRRSTAVPGVCLETGQVYTVLLELKKYGGPDSPSASVLIDSVYRLQIHVLPSKSYDTFF